MNETVVVRCRGAYPEMPLAEPVEVTVSTEGNLFRHERRVGCPFAREVEDGRGILGMVFVRCMAKMAEVDSTEALEQAKNQRVCHHKRVR